MSVVVKFITESRKLFAIPGTEMTSKVLGAFEATDVLIVKRWQQSDEVKVKLFVNYSWFMANIAPSEDPTSSKAELSRARYFSIRNEYGEENVYWLQNYAIGEKRGEVAELEVSGGDARVASETMTSAPNSSGEDWGGTRTIILTRLFDSLCNSPRDGMAAWQRLPVSSISNFAPTATEAQQGFIPLSAIEFGEQYTIGSPDPLPVARAIQEFYGYLPDHEIAPVTRWAADGKQSPWWQWGVRERVSSRALFSEHDGSMVANNLSGSNEQTETMSYASKDYVRARYAAGVNQGRTALSGPWAGFKADSANPPTGANIDTFLTSRARSATLRNKRITFDFTLNFSRKNIRPTIGMTTFARIGGLVYRVNVDEIASSYTAERGWETTAPVFVNQDSIKVASIKDGPFIEFQTTSNDLVFTVPTNYGAATGFRWTVEVDGVFYGEYQGVSSSASLGITVNYAVVGTHTIRIYDTTGEYRAGWARAFGFYDNMNGAGNTTNRNRVTRIVSDSDWGHLISSVSDGDFFRAYQWYNCLNLTVGAIEMMPSTVVNRGGAGYYWQYYNCRKLQVASPESMGMSVQTIGSSHRVYQYYNCFALYDSAVEDCSPVLKTVGSSFKESQFRSSGIVRAMNEKLKATVSVGSSFRYSQFEACQNLVFPGTEDFHEPAGFDALFREAQYANCPKLATYADEAPMSGVQTYSSGTNRGYRNRQYQSCVSLGFAAIEKSRVTVAEYRTNQYSGCVKLKLPGTEVAGITIPAISFTSFRSGQYYGCTGITETVPEIAPLVLASGVSNYRASMYQGCISLTAAAVEVAQFPANISLQGFRSQQYYGCTSLVKAADEVLNAPTATLGDFRRSQYEACSALVNPPLPDSRHGNGGVGFRVRQFFGCTSLIAPQQEYAATITVNTASSSEFDVLTSQYEGCTSLKIAAGTVERYTASMSGNAGIKFRDRQFFGCTSIVYPMIEATASIVFSAVNSRGSLRSYQYGNCTSLTTTSVEQPMSGTVGVLNNFRTGQYRGCSALSDYKANRLGTETRDQLPAARGAAFRSNQFQLTPATNVAGNRVRFKDGAEAIPGTNTPNDIY